MNTDIRTRLLTSSRLTRSAKIFVPSSLIGRLIFIHLALCFCAVVGVPYSPVNGLPFSPFPGVWRADSSYTRGLPGDPTAEDPPPSPCSILTSISPLAAGDGVSIIGNGIEGFGVEGADD